MSDKKIEELINIAKGEETNESYVKPSQVEEFFIETNLTPTDDDKVDSQNIYWVYQKWCLQKQATFLTRQKFFKELRKKAKFTYSRGTTFVYVKKEPYDLSQDEWLLMRRSYRREINDSVRKQREKQKKKK